MNGSLVRALASSSLLVTLSLVAAPATAAPKESATVPMETQAWYQEVPPCVSLVDCAALPAASPYPEDTLHVAISAGQERARTYLAFSLLVIPPGGKLLGGTLDLPIDTEPGSGSFSPERADMLACAVESEFEPARGSAEKPPQTACKDSAPAVFDAKAGAFSVDLEPFVDGWGGTRAALALFPPDAARQGGSTWHVTFPAPEPDEPDAPRIEATLTYSAPGDQFTAAAGPPAPAGGSGVTNPLPETASAQPAPSFGGGGVTPFVEAPPAAAPPPPAPIPAAPSALAQLLPSGFAGPGFAYPTVWALPLVLLAGFSAIGRALTKELYRRV